MSQLAKQIYMIYLAALACKLRLKHLVLVLNVLFRTTLTKRWLHDSSAVQQVTVTHMVAIHHLLQNMANSAPLCVISRERRPYEQQQWLRNSVYSMILLPLRYLARFAILVDRKWLVSASETRQRTTMAPLEHALICQILTNSTKKLG